MITATVSHEMRTPINTILTMLESLMMIMPNEEAIHMCTIIKNSALLLLYIVNDMLDSYMLKTGKFCKIEEQFSFQDNVIEVFEMFQVQTKAKQIGFTLAFCEDMPTEVVTDSRRYKQVIINLLSNALKFTMKGGIQIRISFDREKEIITTHVSDTGVGISKNEQIKLFKLFGKLESSSAQNKTGIGLGLNISKRIVSEFEGEFSCDSQVGHGTTFTYTWKVKDFIYHRNKKHNEK